MRAHITDELVARLRPEEDGARRRVVDTKVRGFWAVAGPMGVVFVASCGAGGRTRKRTLGRWPELAVEEARGRAREFLALAANGKVADRSTLTLRSAWPLHRAALELAGRAPRTIESYERLWRCGAADVMDVPLARLAGHPELVAAVFERLSVKQEGRGGRVVANRTLAAIRSTYNFARRRLDRTLPSEPPTSVCTPHRERRRDTAFDRRTLPEWWAAKERLQNPVRRAMWEAILLTGARPGSIRLLSPGDWDQEGRVLRLEHVKTQPYAVPVTAALEAVLARAREAGALLHPTRAAEYIFPGARGPVVEHKQRGLPRDAGSLRQTYASCAASIGVPELLIAALLGHAARGITQGYITRAAMVDSLRDAAEQVSLELLAWTEGQTTR